jgi:hypothetical protein
MSIRMVVPKSPIVLEATHKNGQSLCINVYEGHAGKEYVGFQFVFPVDCKVINFSENSIIIVQKLDLEEE